MIEAKEVLIGSLNTSTVVIKPDLEDLTVTPNKEEQVFTHKDTYGYDNVTVKPISEQYIIPSGDINISQNGTYDVKEKENAIVNVPDKKLGTKSITSNGTYKASDDNLDGYSKLDVDVSADFSEYFTSPMIKGDQGNLSGVQLSLKKIPSGLTINDTTALFSNCRNLEDISNLANAVYTSTSLYLNYMFYNCWKITNFPNINATFYRNMSYMFSGCRELISIAPINIQDLHYMSYAFQSCFKLITIPEFDTKYVQEMNSVFSSCTSLTTIPLLNFQSVTKVNGMLYQCTELTTVNGFQNYGQAFGTSVSANYSQYTLGLTYSTKLTEQSLINILTNLYDIATKGCKTQTIQFGATNLAKLTSTEGQAALTQAQNYGWTIS